MHPSMPKEKVKQKIKYKQKDGVFMVLRKERREGEESTKRRRSAV